MKIIILDFTDATLKIIEDIEENTQIEDIELLMCEKYNLKTSNIEYMIVPDLKIETLN